MLLRIKRQASLDQLMQAVVSVYLYMAQMSSLTRDEISIVDKVLRGVFGQMLPLYKIEQAYRNIRLIRVASNILNQHLSKADKMSDLT